MSKEQQKAVLQKAKFDKQVHKSSGTPLGHHHTLSIQARMQGITHMKGNKTKRTFLLLPPAQVGAVQSIGVTAITVSNDRSGRHWGIRTCWWFWRGSKVSASCSAWSGRKEKEVETVLLLFLSPAPPPTQLQGLAELQLVTLHRIYCFDLFDHISKQLSGTETSGKKYQK